MTDNCDIRAVMNDRALMNSIAELLEQDNGCALKELALAFNVSDPSQLTSVEPSRQFFTHLANSQLDIKLADLKILIEQTLDYKRATIFPSIEQDIEAENVGFTLESKLADIQGQNWLYLLKNVADKLLENTCRLPSWKDIADHYDYDYNTIESFSIHLPEVRPAVKLLKHLSFMEVVPTIATLKNHLKSLDRNDIVEMIEKRFPEEEEEEFSIL